MYLGLNKSLNGGMHDIVLLMQALLFYELRIPVTYDPSNYWIVEDTSKLLSRIYEATGITEYSILLS